jgi:AcrR family transcriptional regulator
MVGNRNLMMMEAYISHGIINFTRVQKVGGPVRSTHFFIWNKLDIDSLIILSIIILNKTIVRFTWKQAMPKVTEAYLDTRRQQIIEAAYRCFARKGFHQTTMREILSEAGLSAGAIYHYFKSKEEIIEASFVYDYQRGLEVFEAAAEDPDPAVAIDHLLDFFYHGLESAAALGADRVNIQGWGEALVNPNLFAPLRETLEAFRDRLQQAIRHGQEQGVFNKSVNSAAAAEVILSSYLGLYLQKAFLSDLDVEKYKEAFLAMLHGKFSSEH